MDSYEKLEERIRKIIAECEAKGDAAWKKYKSREYGGNSYDEGASDTYYIVIGYLKDALKGDLEI